MNKALKHFQKRLRQLSLLDGAKNTAWHCNVSYRNFNNNVNISTIEKHSVVINLLLHFCACSNKISLLVFYRTKHVQWIHTCLTGPHFVIAPRCFSLIWQPWCHFFQKYVETQDNIALFQQSRESFPRTSPQLQIFLIWIINLRNMFLLSSRCFWQPIGRKLVTYSQRFWTSSKLISES